MFLVPKSDPCTCKSQMEKVSFDFGHYKKCLLGDNVPGNLLRIFPLHEVVVMPVISEGFPAVFEGVPQKSFSYRVSLISLESPQIKYIKGDTWL